MAGAGRAWRSPFGGAQPSSVDERRHHFPQRRDGIVIAGAARSHAWPRSKHEVVASACIASLWLLPQPLPARPELARSSPLPPPPFTPSRREAGSAHDHVVAAIPRATAKLRVRRPLRAVGTGGKRRRAAERRAGEHRVRVSRGDAKYGRHATE